MLKKINILDPLSPRTVDSYDLETMSSFFPRIIGISQTESHIFIMRGLARGTQQLSESFQTIAYDLAKKKPLAQPKNMFDKTIAVAMIPNSDILITGSNGQFQMFQLFKDVPNKKTFCLFNQTSYNFPSVIMVEPSADPNVYFSLTSDRVFQTYNVTNRTSPQQLGLYKFNPDLSWWGPEIFFHLSPSKDHAFLGMNNSIFIMNVSDPTALSFLGVDTCHALLNFVSSPQEGIGFVLELPIHKDYFELSVTNYSNMSSITKTPIATNLKGESGCYHLLLSKNGHLLFLQLINLTIYNVSDPINPIEISSHQLLPHASNPQVRCLVLSEDEKTLFAIVMDDAKLATLRIFDISDLANFKLLQVIALPKAESRYYDSKSVIISTANKKALVMIDQGFLVIDLRNLTSSVILGIIPFARQVSIDRFFLSPDEKIVNVLNSRRNWEEHNVQSYILQINLEDSFTLYLPQEDFLLGQKYTDDPMLLQLNEASDFLLTSRKEYKIIKLSLFDLKIVPSHANLTISYTNLPPWITFDSENQILSVETKKQRELGSYTLSALASKKIPFDAFNSILSNTTLSQELLTFLVTVGYIDTQRFLTPNFDLYDDFLVPIQYAESKEKIYHILNSYCILTFTDFRILPSLKLATTALDKKLSLATPSNTSVKIDIKLNNSTKAQFLQKTYGTLQPIITERKSRLTMEGPLDSINKALQDLVVNLDAPCGGEITINDNLNRPITESIENISDYFWHNNVPTLTKLSVQQQIDLIPLYTGQYFSINLDPTSFSDKFIENLSYELIQREDGKEKNHPEWLSFHNLNIQGTPPEDLLHRKFNLILIVKNEFKQTEIPVVLNIKISWALAGKTLLKYSPYILTVIGLIVFANKIRNVLAKKRYRHPKDFYVRVGEEITPSIIFPIRFIAEEKAEGDLILKYLQRKMGSRSHLVESLLSYSQLDEAKIKASIKEIVNQMPVNDKKKLRLSLKALNFGEKRVYQYIINELVIWQLDVSSKETKNLFDSLKEKWAEFIDYDNQSQCFKINEKIFNTIVFGKVKESFSDTENGSLLSESPPEVDLVLLKKALIVYAAKIHEINCFDYKIDIQVKLQVPKNLLLKFLKEDLQKINYVEKSRFIYGLGYRIQKNALHVFGTPDESFEGKVLVLQITNSRQRILNEFWIYEASSNSDANLSKSSFISESQAKGKEYEIF